MNKIELLKIIKDCNGHTQCNCCPHFIVECDTRNDIPIIQLVENFLTEEIERDKIRKLNLNSFYGVFNYHKPDYTQLLDSLILTSRGIDSLIDFVSKEMERNNEEESAMFKLP